jgi:hypothetical protein
MYEMLKTHVNVFIVFQVARIDKEVEEKLVVERVALQTRKDDLDKLGEQLKQKKIELEKEKLVIEEAKKKLLQDEIDKLKKPVAEQVRYVRHLKHN